MGRSLTKKKVFTKGYRGAGSGAVIDSMYSGTYATIDALRVGGTLQPGRKYLVTDKADLGIELTALTSSTFSTKGDAGFYCADWQTAGVYSGVQAQTGIPPLNPLGLWNGVKGNFDYDTLAGGTFTVGNYIKFTVASSGSCQILSDDGTTLDYNLLDGATPLNNAVMTECSDAACTIPTGVTALVNGANTYTFQPLRGDIVIWFKTAWVNYQKITTTNSNTDPFSDLVNWAELTLSATKGYIEKWVEVEYDFVNDTIVEIIEINNNSAINTISGLYAKFPLNNVFFAALTWNVKNFTLKKPTFTLAGTQIGRNCNLTINEFDGNIGNSVFHTGVSYSGNGNLQDTADCVFGATSTIVDCTELIGMTIGQGVTVDGGALYGLQYGTIDNGQAVTLTASHSNESIQNTPMIP